MPLIASAAIGAAGSLGGGLIGSKSSKKAAKQAGAIDTAVAHDIQNTGEANFGQTQDLLNPYLNAGHAGVDQLVQQMGPDGQLSKQFSFDPASIKDNPNYQFVLQQGTDAVQKSAAAQGGLFTGGTMKALDQYSQGLATNTINDAYSQALSTFQTNHNNLFNGLTALTNVGQNSINQLEAAQAQREGARVAAGQAYMGAGGAQAAGTAGAGNAWSNALAGITGNVQAAINPIGTAVPKGSDIPIPSSNPNPTLPPPTYIPPAPVVRPVPTNIWMDSMNSPTGDTY